MNQEINEILLLLLRQYRLQCDLLNELGAHVHALREFLVDSDRSVDARLQQLEAEAKAATSLPKQLTLRKLDDIIRKLESLRMPDAN